MLEKAAELRGESRIVHHSSGARKMGGALQAQYLGKNGGNLGGNSSSMFFGGIRAPYYCVPYTYFRSTSKYYVVSFHPWTKLPTLTSYKDNPLLMTTPYYYLPRTPADYYLPPLILYQVPGGRDMGSPSWPTQCSHWRYETNSQQKTPR